MTYSVDALCRIDRVQSARVGDLVVVVIRHTQGELAGQFQARVGQVRQWGRKASGRRTYFTVLPYRTTEANARSLANAMFRAAGEGDIRKALAAGHREARRLELEKP